jgi:hypothetical protein
MTKAKTFAGLGVIGVVLSVYAVFGGLAPFVAWAAQVV